MKKPGLALLWFFLLACTEKRPAQKIHPDLAPLLEIYLEHAPNPGQLHLLTVMDFGELGPDLSGGCWFESERYWVGGTVREERRRILVERDHPPFTFQRIVFHELGHCLHNLEHTENPDDIMFGGDGVQREEFWEQHLMERLDAMLAF